MFDPGTVTGAALETLTAAGLLVVADHVGDLLVGHDGVSFRGCLIVPLHQHQ